MWRLVKSKAWAGMVSVGLVVAIVLSLVPIGISFDLSNILSIGMQQVAAQTLGVGEEVDTQRTAVSKTFYEGDNRYKMLAVGLIHYEDAGAWYEIDNSWEAGTAPWDWQMVQDSYQTYALSDFTYGQILKFEHKGSSVAFQPMGLQWLSKEGGIEEISMPQSVAASVNNTPRDDIALDMGTTFGNIAWENAYGSGRHFTWTAYPGRLGKILQLDEALPTPPQWLLDQGGVQARLSFIFAPSSGLDIYVNESLWDKASKVETVDRIEFRKEGDILWYFNPAEYWATGLNWTPQYVWTNPDTAEGSGWSNPDNAKDGDTVSYATYSVPAQQWSEPLVLSLAEASLVDRVRIYSNGGAQISAIRVEAYYLDQWVSIYEGTLVKGSWQTYTIPDGEVEVSAVRVSYWNSHSSATRDADCHAVQFWASDLAPDTAGIATTALRKVGTDFYVDVVVSYDWLTKVEYPVYIDPEVETWTSGTDNWDIPSGVDEIEVLVVAGGGGAGKGWTNTAYNAGGGGAGGLIHIEEYDISGKESPISITVGSGGASASIDWANGSNGQDSKFGVLTAKGGGGGGSVQHPAGPGQSGGSGGGGGCQGGSYHAGGSKTQTTTNDGYASTGFGNAGRASYSTNNAGGGGGAGAASTSTTGGAGKAVNGVTYAKGGNAHSNNANGAANTGDGGNAAATNSGNNGGSGGSGIVKIWYELPPAEPEISNTPSTYAFGTLAVNTTAVTGLDYFTVTNNSSFAVDIYISGTDMTGIGGNWTLSDNATAGNMTYGLEAGLDGGSYNVTVKKTEPHNKLVSSLAASGTQKWGLKMYAPTAYLDGSGKSGNITLEAVASS